MPHPAPCVHLLTTRMEPHASPARKSSIAKTAFKFYRLLAPLVIQVIMYLTAPAKLALLSTAAV
jgi:hypothetical protein